MFLSHLSLTQFRNITAAEIDFSPGVNVLWGDNAQGKSNILEAIYYCARGRSFRGAAEKQMIQNGAEFAGIRVDYRKSGAEFPSNLEFALPRAGKKIMLRDGVKETSVFNMVGLLKAVLFTPQHLSLITGSPQERRTFMDIAISMCYPSYMTGLSSYKHNLEARNALLREMAATGQTGGDLISVFTRRIAEIGAYVAVIRFDFLKRMNLLAARQVSALSHGQDTLQLQYVSGGGEIGDPKRTLNDPVFGLWGRLDQEYVESTYEKMMSDLPRELAMKTTLYGPHRDDIDIALNGMPARHFASQGQTRSVTLALKMAEGTLLWLTQGEKPVYLLDDVLSELDESRREYLLRELKDDQLIITSCEPDFRVRGITEYPHLKRQRVTAGSVFEM